MISNTILFIAGVAAIALMYYIVCEIGKGD